MMVKTLAAIMAAILVVASAAGSFYFAGAQEQSHAVRGQAKITLGNDQVQAGSKVNVSGSDFNANSDVSTYFMSAAHVDLTNGSALVLQEIAADNNQSQTASVTSNGSNDILGNTLNSLRDMLGLGGNSNETNTASNNASSQGHLLAVLDTKLANSTVSLKCDNQDIAQGSLNDASIVNLAAEPGTYSSCSIAVTDGNATDNGDIGRLTVTADPDEGYENSKISSVKTDAQGSFAESVTVPEAEAGEFAILAADSEGSAAVSRLSIAAQSSAAGTVTNATSAANATTGEAATNGTITNETTTDTLSPNANVTQNQTENKQTNASVQVDEKSAEPGSPLTVTGEGFKPNMPVQVFINNIQITNVITNIEGSFNTVVIVPTMVNAGSANVVVKTEQTNISENVNIVAPEGQNKGPATLRFTAVSATDRAQTLKGAPVTIFDASSGRLVDSGKTPINVELEAGTYSVFYSDFKSFDFASAEPGKWTDTPDGGSGLITVREGRNATVTAMYAERPSPPPAPKVTDNSLVLRAKDTDGNPVSGMFATIYDASTGEKVEQGFTEMKVDHLKPGTYPIFFANFNQLAFVSASPGSWVQTTFGGAGLVTISDDGSNHNVVVTAVYDRITTATSEEQFHIRAPLDVKGDIFSITSNQTRPEGPFVMSGSFALKVSGEDPVKASLSTYFMSAREDSNENMQLDSQRSRDHDTFQIADFRPQIARPVGPDSYLVSGTADLLLNGDMYSDNEKVQIMVRGGGELTPTNIEIEFQGQEKYSAAHRLETLFGVVTSGFQ